jgi:hypothetical protein
LKLISAYNEAIKNICKIKNKFQLAHSNAIDKISFKNSTHIKIMFWRPYYMSEIVFESNNTKVADKMNALIETILSERDKNE